MDSSGDLQRNPHCAGQPLSVTPRMDPEQGDISCPTPQAQRGPGACTQRIPAVPRRTPSDADGVAGLTYAVGGGQEQEEQREHGAGCWLPRAGCAGSGAPRPRGTRLWSPKPPTFLPRPQPRGKQVGLVSPAAFVMFERPPARRAENRCLCDTGGDSSSRALGRGDIPHPTDPTSGSKCPPHPHQGPPSQGPTWFLRSLIFTWLKTRRRQSQM